MSDASKTPRERPLSPHVSIWRWHLTMATSILHRASGVALYVGALIAAGWAIALAQGPAAYACFQQALGSIPGKVVLFGLTAAFFYHLANGLRHLVWDLGHGLDVKTANLSGVVVLAFTVAATLAVWFIAATTGAL